MNFINLPGLSNPLLLQVNVFLSFSTILGLFDMVLAVLYPVLVFSLLFSSRTRLTGTEKVLQTILAIAMIPILLVVGGILFFQGWRQDPILQFAIFLLHLILVASLAKDFLIYLNR
jgi:hypothetical protein